MQKGLDKILHYMYNIIYLLHNVAKICSKGE